MFYKLTGKFNMKLIGNIAKGALFGLTVVLVWILCSPPAHCQTAKTGSANVFSQGTTGSAGTVTAVATGNGLQGGTITTTGTIDLRLNSSGGLSKTLGGGSNELGIAAGGVTNAMLAGSITFSNLVGTDITAVGTITTGTWSATAISLAKGGTGLTSAADDTTMVSSGSAWVATALPNCTDTGGNHLNYTTATNAFSCGTSSSGGGGGSPGGSSGNLQYNNAGAFGGISIANFTSGRIEFTGRVDISTTDVNTRPFWVNLPTGSNWNAEFALNGNTFASFTPRKTLNLAATADSGSTVDNDLWNSSDQFTYTYRIKGRNFYVPATLFTAANSVNLLNSTTETTLIANVAGSKTVTSNLPATGKTICAEGYGYVSTLASPGTITFKYKVGSVVIGSTGAVTPVGSLSNALVETKACYTYRGTGVSANVAAQGFVKIYDGVGGVKYYPIVNTSLVTIDTTAAGDIDFTGQWSSASVSNTITITNIFGYIYN